MCLCGGQLGLTVQFGPVTDRVEVYGGLNGRTDDDGDKSVPVSLCPPGVAKVLA